MHRAIPAAVATVLLMYTFPRVADAQELPFEKSEKILIVADETQVDRMNTLAEVLRSHFRDLNAEVQAVAVSLPQKDLPAQVETVRALVISKGALSGIWIEESIDEIFLFVSDKLTKKVLVQTFDSGKESWEVECETVAALVRSALITWLEVVPEPLPPQPDAPTPVSEAPTPKPETEPPKPKPETRDEVKEEEKEASKQEAKEERFVRPPRGKIARTRRERRPRRERHRASSGPAPKRRPFVGIVDAAFAPRMLHPDEPWTYNARLGSRLQLFETISLGASVEVGTPSKLDIPNIEEEVLLRRVPLSIDARFTHSFGRFGIEAGLALDICFSYFDDNPGWGGTPNTTLTTYGLGAFLAGTFRIIPHLSFFAGVGVDFYFKTSRYFWDDTPFFYVSPTQLFFTLGLAVDFGR